MRTLRAIAVTRYVTPLREGGSLPAIVEADDEEHLMDRVVRRSGPS